MIHTHKKKKNESGFSRPIYIVLRAYNGPDQVTCKIDYNNLMMFTIEIQKAVTKCGEYVGVHKK
jgi:hypothetical protein